MSNKITHNISTKEIKEDNELKEKYNYVDKQSKEFSNQVLGKVTDTFIKDVDFLTGEREVTTMPISQLKETPVIQLINEVQKYYANADVSSEHYLILDQTLKKEILKEKMWHLSINIRIHLWELILQEKI